MQTVQSRITETRAASREAGARYLILLAAGISFVLSVALWFGSHELQGIFVGLWVPSILSLGGTVLRRERP
jgi:hypothetical protein